MDNIIEQERYIFWLDDISILVKNKNYLKFIPTSSMTRIEQLNSLSRFFLYLLIIFLLFDKTSNYIYLPIIGLIFIVILYFIYENDDNGKRKELLRMKRNENFDELTNNNEINYVLDNDVDSLSSNENDDINVSYYDSNNKLIDKNDKKNDVVKYTLDEMKMYENARCRKPTKDNPFMNPTIDDFNKENTPIACNSDDKDINNDIDIKFNEDLYRDVDDVFDRKNSQRQFFTIAHNIPNDQEAFARWCYKFPKTCKEDQERCLRYEDLRTKVAGVE